MDYDSEGLGEGGLAILYFFRLSGDARSSKIREVLFQEPVPTWFLSISRAVASLPPLLVAFPHPPYSKGWSAPGSSSIFVPRSVFSLGQHISITGRAFEMLDAQKAAQTS